MRDTPTTIRPEAIPQQEGTTLNGATVVVPHPDVKEEDRLENHPLWPALLAEIAANRKADLERDQVQYPAE